MEFNLSIIPDSSEMFARFASETWSLAILILVMILTAFTLCLYIEALVLFHMRFEYGSRRGYVIFLCGLYPVHSVTSLLGISIPTASSTCNSLADIYMATSLYVFLLLITELFGGVDSTVRALYMQGVPLRQPPCCCCLCCLPSINVDKKVIYWIRIGVLQYIVVLLLVALLSALLWINQLLQPNQSTSIYESIERPAIVINALSTLIAIYSVSLLFKAARAPLGRFHLPGLFITVQLVLVLVNLQRIICAGLIRFGAVGCIRHLTCNDDLVIKTILNLLILFEMPLLMLMNRVVVSRWIRSGTYTQYFEDDNNANVEGDKQNMLDSLKQPQ